MAAKHIEGCRGDRLSYIRGCDCLAARVAAAEYARQRRAVRKTGGYVWGKLMASVAESRQL